MAKPDLQTDYLVVGCGAGGMAFVDTLLAESDADIVIVDTHHKPGGHWNVAYPFVTLHQPSAFYGVSSRELSSGELDRDGLNKGLGIWPVVRKFAPITKRSCKRLFCPQVGCGISQCLSISERVAFAQQ